MKIRGIFIASVIGILGGIASAIYYNAPKHAQPPAFDPAANPFASGVYANGIVESDQGSGSNIDLFAEVAAPVVHIYAKEGDNVAKGDPLIGLDDRVQRAQTNQLDEQAAAALAQLQALKAQPRPENLHIADAQLSVAQAALKTVQDQYEKQKHSFSIDAGSVSREALDTAQNNVHAAEAAVALAKRQYELTRAGAWSYDIKNQESQYRALQKAAEAAHVLLGKYIIRAPIDGSVLAINAAEGGYVSPQGTYSPYIQANQSLAILGSPQHSLNVRVYLDEILVGRLPPPDQIHAEMVVRGSGEHVPLSFVRIQPYVSPKIDLSDQRQERVDVRVLPLIFRFPNDGKRHLYPGQLVDVFISGTGAAP